VLGRDDGPVVSGSRSPTLRPSDDISAHGYDDRVTAPRPRAAVPLLPILAIGLTLLAAACGAAATGSSRPSAGARSSNDAASPALTPVPGAPSPALGPTVGPPKTTDTEFGKIFDALPPSFPTLPGQEPADTTAGPTSGSFVANTTVAAASAAIRAALVGQGWSVDVGSPLEDGSVVLEASGQKAGCKTEVRFTPLSGTVIMSVLYGASCPFG